MKFSESLVLLLVLVGSAQSVAGQTTVSSQDGVSMQANINSLLKGLPAELPGGSAEMKGSPYAIPRWLPAHLVVSNNLPLASVPLKYDVLHQRLLMRANFTTRDSLLLDDHTVTRFTLDEPAMGMAPAHTRLFQRFFDSPDTRYRNSYVEVLHEGRYALLKLYVKVLHAADFQNAYSSHIDEVEDREYYFLRRPDASVVPVKLNLKSFAAVAPELTPKLKQAAGAAKTGADWAAALQTADPK